MAPKDPHVVLGVEPGAPADDIKAAWRRLARQNHPDLTGDDPEASRRATRRMAEINTAYAALTRNDAATGRRGRFAAAGPTNGHAQPGAGTRRGGPPPERPTRPVTGRLDTTETFRPRNQTTTSAEHAQPLRGQPPLRWNREQPELRASDPSGPTYRDVHPEHRPTRPPSLEDAMGFPLDFGKFRGHSLGEVAAFEPSYVDWLASTVNRDPELGAAARVVRDELDRRGIRRAQRPIRPGWRSNPFV